MARIERAVYRSGFVAHLEEAKRLPAITIEPADLPEDVVALVDARLLDLGGTYGDPEAGDPIQYDELCIQHDQSTVEIVVHNRAIPLFTTDSEAVRRIHEVCCRLDDIAARRCRTGQIGWVKLYCARREICRRPLTRRGVTAHGVGLPEVAPCRRSRSWSPRSSSCSRLRLATPCSTSPTSPR